MEESKIRSIFSANLKRLMERDGINQKELADKIGVSAAQVSLWCLGRNVPRSGYLAMLTEALHCELSDLLTDKAKDPSHKSERSLPDGYYQLSEEKRALVDNLIRQLAEPK